MLSSQRETMAVVESTPETKRRLLEIEEEIRRLQQVVCELLLANQHLRFAMSQKVMETEEIRNPGYSAIARPSGYRVRREDLSRSA
jgi:hypothetical protein